jgi:hypothetical protein
LRKLVLGWLVLASTSSFAARVMYFSIPYHAVQANCRTNTLSGSCANPYVNGYPAVVIEISNVGAVDQLVTLNVYQKNGTPLAAATTDLPLVAGANTTRSVTCPSCGSPALSSRGNWPTLRDVWKNADPDSFVAPGQKFILPGVGFTLAAGKKATFRHSIRVLPTLTATNLYWGSILVQNASGATDAGGLVAQGLLMFVRQVPLFNNFYRGHQTLHFPILINEGQPF